ncbi:uncharacterized protein LOC128953975 [Oppia nitens]|uniref:uncharacterized protein LOC128953975 n=1 Tax=Oppia nitens TaxID=1686743 RepID=UPI0023DCE6CE|nr:uncharacterized protein LOC128953975 [Oppia nitens]
MSLNSKYHYFNNYNQPLLILLPVLLLLLLALTIDQSQQYCAKFGRHLLQHQCVLTPESSEGPFYLPYHLTRRDVREDREGLPFVLKLTVTDVNTCEPLNNVTVDIWQADASGEYSGYVRASPSGGGHSPPSDNATFLRGIQMTDQNGQAEFMTIFPGWYDPRTTHIHLQTHLAGRTLHTGQLYFPDKMVARIGRYYPYNNTKYVRMNNAEDWLFKRFNGQDSMIQRFKPLRGRRLANGLVGEIIVGLDPNMDSKEALHGRG